MRPRGKTSNEVRLGRRGAKTRVINTLTGVNPSKKDVVFLYVFKVKLIPRGKFFEMKADGAIRVTLH